jgi:hypothetical protein
VWERTGWETKTNKGLTHENPRSLLSCINDTAIRWLRTPDQDCARHILGRADADKSAEDSGKGWLFYFPE